MPIRPPKGLTAAEIRRIERFWSAIGMDGPLFDQRPRHHGQHSWTCSACREFVNAKKKRPGSARDASNLPDQRQPWDPRPPRG